ncbi:MAG: MBL fold metallo-hydrolase [Promethearchaeota archaeon]
MEQKVKITLLGGVNEVGGNMVFLEDFHYNVSIFLDFGINIKKFNECYDRDEEPNSIEELWKLKLLPEGKEVFIKNLYTKTHFKNNQKRINKSKAEENPVLEDPQSNLDGILISHPHKDHFFGLSFVNRNIPIHAGEVTKKIILAYYESSKLSIRNNYSGLNWKLFRTGDTIEIKEMKIIPFHVDHSIPAAYGFIIESSAGLIVYSGDFRMHGHLSWMTHEFIKKINEMKLNTLIKQNNIGHIQKHTPNKIKALLCEGTHIHKGTIESERIVKRNLKTLFKNIPFDFILVKYDRIDWDRFRTFSNIAKHHDWKYIITEKDAYFYYLLNRGAMYKTMKNPNILNDEHLYILINRNVRYNWQKKIRRIMFKYNKQHRFLKYNELRQLKGKFFLYITYLSNFLIDKLNPNLKGIFISSSIDPYAEEFYDNTKRIINILKDLGIPSYRIHASGHAMPHDLIKFVKEIAPQNLIPIHTEHPNFFKKLFNGSDINVIVPEYNNPIIF